LGDLPVHRALWTVHGPPGVELSQTLSPHQSDPAALEILRAEAIAELTGTAAALAENEPAEAVQPWYLPWQHRFVQAAAAARQALLHSDDPDEAAVAEASLRALEQEQEQFSRQLGAVESTASAAAQPDAASQALELWQARHRGPALYASIDSAGQLEVRRAAFEWVDPLRRLAAILFLLALAVAVMILGQRRWLAGLYAWRHVAGVAFGLAWWLWLSPGVVGLLLAVISLAAGIAAWLRPSREATSSIVTLSTPGR
jgi:hypothetical protein